MKALAQKNFMKYHLVTDLKVRKEPLAKSCFNTHTDDACTMGYLMSLPTFPKWLDELNSSEQALMILARRRNPKSGRLISNKHSVLGDMSKLYVKRKLRF